MDETRQKRIIFRAWRRGFREADLIFGPFAESHVHAMTPAELDDMDALLDAPDQDVYDWVTGRAPPPAPFDTAILKRVQAFKASLPIASGDLSGS